MDLRGKEAKEVGKNEGGSYKIWDPSEFPLLAEAKLGAAFFSLHFHGFAFPHYADSSKLGYVLQGDGIVGIVEGKKEKVISLKKGDIIPVPRGTISWWFNNHSTPLLIVFLGETSVAQTPGVFSYFFLSGSQGIFSSFSHNFLSRAFPDLPVETLITSQPESLFTRLPDGCDMPEPNEESRRGSVFNCLEVEERVVTVNAEKLGLLGRVGLGAQVVGLGPGDMYGPGFGTESGLRVVYVVGGRGRVEVVGGKGERLLEGSVKAGDLFVVPRFCVLSLIADEDDGPALELFSVITSPEPEFTELAGKTSVWNILSPKLLEPSFNVSQEVALQFRSANNSPK